MFPFLCISFLVMLTIQCLCVIGAVYALTREKDYSLWAGVCTIIGVGSAEIYMVMLLVALIISVLEKL